MSAATPPTPTAPPTSVAPQEITIVSHSTLFYWWPVWALGFILALLSAFENQVMAVVPAHSVAERGATVVPKVHDFLAALIQELSQRYRPELAGELHTRVVAGGLEVTGQGVRLDVKRRDTGAAVSSLDIPVSLKIRVDALGVTLSDTTIRLDVVK